MAEERLRKNFAGIAIELTECPVCMNTMSAPIFQCQSGHSLCSSCTKALCPPNCPICRQPMTQMRNLKLEEIVDKVNVPCPNKLHGCCYILPSKDVDNHLKECIFRIMACPLSVFGKCSWTGNCKGMMTHFKEHHPQNCNINIDSEVELNNVSTKEDDRFVYLVSQGNILFIITVKIDVLQKVVYWVIQVIGSKKVAQQHIYEIHIASKQDSRRKIIFTDHCFSNAITADEVYRIGKCATLPLNVFSHFILNNKFSFKFFIKRSSTEQKSKYENSMGEHKKKQPSQGFVAYKGHKFGGKGKSMKHIGPK